jgi:chorismate lyase / 3-hydroxybenzoate synthase
MNTTASSTAAGTGSLQLELLSSREIIGRPASWWHGVLGVAGFEKPPVLDRARIPVTASMIRPLGAEDLCEVWRIADPDARLTSGSAQAGLHYRYSDDLLFGCLAIAESAIDASSESGALLHATEIAYQEIFDLLNETGHGQLIRIWNYLPRINEQADGDERYRHFNSARQTAFRNSGRDIKGAVPAACALGSPSGSPLSIYFLAARRPPKAIENPRQTSAYHYPPKFGKHSPIFSRACVWGEVRESKLFVSGTASIVGHETLHAGDVVAQTRETVANIAALINEANRTVGASRFSWEGLMLKVYVRNPVSLPAIEHVLAELPPPASIVYLQADVCRQDLLVEIEAVGIQI